LGLLGVVPNLWLIVAFAIAMSFFADLRSPWAWYLSPVAWFPNIALFALAIGMDYWTASMSAFRGLSIVFFLKLICVVGAFVVQAIALGIDSLVAWDWLNNTFLLLNLIAEAWLAFVLMSHVALCTMRGGEGWSPLLTRRR
jgi:hypothetical protein